MTSNLQTFLNILSLSLKTFAQQKMRIISFFLLVALLCLGAGLAGNFLMTGQSIAGPISIAVVDLDNSFETGLIISAVTESSENYDLLTITSHTAESAKDALENGTVAAVITLPENFGRGIITGENIPFTVTYNQDMPLSSAFVRISADAFANMLRISQIGVYVTLNYAAMQELPPEQYNMIFMGVNMRFLNLVLNRDEIFISDIQSVTGGLLIWQAYFIAAYTALMMCAAFVMTDAIRRNFNRLSLISLKNRGMSLYMVFLACVNAYFLLFLVLNTGLWLFANILLTALNMPLFALSTSMLMGVFVVAAILSAFAAMLTFAFENHLSAGAFTAVFMVISLFLSGGIIPVAFFSDSLQILSNIVWNTWGAKLLGAALIGENIALPMAVCIFFALIFTGIGCIAAGKKGELQK